MEGVDYDVIIVGAGTAGCYLAKRLVKAGLDVCVLEQSQRTKADSGIVSSYFFEHIPERSLIKARIKAMDLIAPNGTKINIRSPKPFAYLLNREKLGKKMRASVRSRVINERFLGCQIHKGWVDVTTSANSSPSARHYSCKVLVGADGTMSGVRKALGIKPPEITWGLIKSEEEGRGPISVFFNKQYSPDGFAWRIPKSGEVGLLSSSRPMEGFQRFLAETATENNRAGRKLARAFHADINSRRHVVGAPIPIGTCRSYTDRAILIGDAAGQVKPLTGGGIVWGLRCARVAAKAIEYSFDANRFDAFFWKTEYEHKWQAVIGRELKRQLAVRKLYGRLGNEQINRIFEIIKPRLERLNEFDYDALSGLAKKLPKFSIAKTIFPALLRLP